MIKVIKEGFFTTVQDSGRIGYRHIGVPVSGAMDAYAAHLANSLLENDTKDALLEITMTGPELLFEVPTAIAITGASMDAYLNGEDIERNSVIPVKEGDLLTFGNPNEGLRTYMAVKNGLQTENVLGSRSYYVPITTEKMLRPGMSLPVESVDDFRPKIPLIQTSEDFSKSVVEVDAGPELNLLSTDQIKQLKSQEFHIAKENNRMAYQLEESIGTHEITMLTSATLPGTVQVTPSGKLIILMRDAQTTGGYPRVLQLTHQAISRLAQKKQGDTIRFKFRG